MKISATSYVTITKIVVTILPLVNVSESSTSVWFPAGQPAVPPSVLRSIDKHPSPNRAHNWASTPGSNYRRPCCQKKRIYSNTDSYQLLFTNLTISRNEVDKRESSPTTWQLLAPTTAVLAKPTWQPIPPNLIESNQVHSNSQCRVPSCQLTAVVSQT